MDRLLSDRASYRRESGGNAQGDQPQARRGGEQIRRPAADGGKSRDLLRSWPGQSRNISRPSSPPLTQASSFGNSTSSMANMIVVNGPIRKQLGMNSGTDVMGPFSEANTIIGRSFTLAGKILGDLTLKTGAYSSLGNNLQYNNVCIAENEEALPQGWEPLSVELGYKRTDNVVSVGVGWSYISSVGEAQLSHPPHMLIRDYMRALTGMAATVVMDPTVAGLLKDAHGFKTKADLGQWLAKNVEVAVGTYWGNGVNATATSCRWRFRDWNPMQHG